MHDPARSPRAEYDTSGPLLAMLAQQLSQPLTAILTLGDAGLRWLDRDTPDLHELKFVLQRLILDARRASETALRLRALATASHQRRSRFALHTLLADSLPRLQQHGIAVELVLDEGDSTVCGHRQQLAQAIDQLLAHTIDAMRQWPGPRRLRIHAQCLTGRHGARQVALEIAGSGAACHGWPPTVGNDGNGGTHGANLSLCRYVIHEHGGQLRVAAPADRSLRVTVILPLAERPARSPQGEGPGH